MTELRPGFKDISSGWTLIDCFDDITDRIERLAKWKEENGPLNELEQRTIELMIRTQMALYEGQYDDLIEG